MSVRIEFKITKGKQDFGHVRIICPYCNHVLKSYDSLRKHLTREHKNELGYAEVKKQASKLYRMYKEARHD